MYSRAYVEITNICNRNCSFCHGHSRAPRLMSEEEFRIVAQKIFTQTEYVYYHVMGEPLTHPLLPRFIGIASEYGLRSAVTTNGTLLDKCGEALVKVGVYKVNISLHSFENEKDYGKYINSCLDFADMASKNGVLVVLRLWNSFFEGGKNEDIVKTIRERFDDCEWAIGKRGVRIRHKLHLEYGERFDWPDMMAEESCSRAFCYGLADHFGVLCDGRVIPCCLDAEGDICLGNIFEDNIEAILSSGRARNIREGFKNGVACEELCRRCGYARRFVES